MQSKKLNTEILFQFLVKYTQPELICDVGTLDASNSISLRNINQKTDILAFEANPYNYKAIISKNISESYNIDVIHKAVSNKSGQLVFNVQKYTDKHDDQWMAGTSSILQRSEEVGDTEEVAVESIRLDEHLNNSQSTKNLNYIALWIDVEGAGYEVLEGIKNITDKITFLQVEVETVTVWKGQKLKSDVQKLMESLGFIEVARGKLEDQHDLVYINQSFYESNKIKCSSLIYLAQIFYYVRKWGGHILSNILLFPILGILRKN